MTRFLESAALRSTEGTAYRTLESGVVDATDVLFEPFDNYTTNAWVTATGTIVAGRTGTGARLSGGAGSIATWTIPTPSQSAYATVGFAVKASALPAGAIAVMRFASSGGTLNEVGLQVTNTGALQIVYGSSAPLAASAAGVITAGVFHYVELAAFNADTGGYVTARVNGVQVVAATGIDTRNGGPVYDRLVLQGASSGVNNIFDDLYLSVGSAAAFKGDITVASPVVVYSDNFDRPDNTPAPAPWSSPLWLSFGNRFYRDMPNGAPEFIRYDVDLTTPDHWVEADVPGTTTNFLVVQARSSGTPGQNCYLGFINPDGQPRIGRMVSGAYSDVAAGGFLDQNGGKLRLEVQGSTQRLYRNGTLLLTANDTSLPTGNYTGLNTGTNFQGFDNFRCGALPWTP